MHSLKGQELETDDLQKVKEMIDKYPIEAPNHDPKLLYKYRNYVDILPLFIKSVDFTDLSQVNTCYRYLEESEQAEKMETSEALALLDAVFGDEKIRLFAVQKLSALNDSFLSLYLPQLVQALKYEPHHQSALSEFLLERALKNPRVVGQSLFWLLKSNLSNVNSHERFYLLMERFLMTCGKFKNDLYR